jgi:hypothetical protein
MVFRRAQASYRIVLSDVMKGLLTSEITKGEYTRAICQIGLMHPFFHPQSHVGKLCSISNDKRSTGYNDGFTDYEAVIEQVVDHLSAAFPEKMVVSEVTKDGSMIVLQACVEASGTIRLLSMCVSIWKEHQKENEVLCGLTLPSLPLTSNSNKKFVLPGTQATEFSRKGMFLAVLHSLQVWIAFRSDYDNRPLDQMFPVPRFWCHTLQTMDFRQTKVV